MKRGNKVTAEELLNRLNRDPEYIARIACALGKAADDDVLADVVGILRDRQHARNRAPLLQALIGSQKPERSQLLSERRQDKDLTRDIDLARK